MSDSWIKRFIKFGLTGVVNFAFGYSLFAILYLAGLHPQTALIISFSIGILWNFMIHGRFVFGTTGYSQLPAYVLVYVVAYLVNRVGLSLAMEHGMSPLIAQLALMVITFVISFIGISIVLTGTIPFVNAIRSSGNGSDTR